MSTFNVFILFSGFCTNFSVILLFVRNASLRTPFTIYLVNLLLANLMCSIAYYPLELLNGLYAVWWAGSAVCTLYQYTLYIAQSAMCNAHALIALNRLWAVTFPVSYRHHHKKSAAVLVCVAMWIFVHVCLLPGLVLDALYYRLPEETNGCMVNTDGMRVYWIIIQFVSYNTPELCVIIAFFAICYKIIRRHQHKVRPSVAVARRQSFVVRSVNVESTNTGTSPSGGVEQRIHNRFLCWKMQNRKTEHGFLMLTLTTLTIFICYTPANVYYTWWAISEETINSLYLPAAVLYEMTAVLDPIWFVLALPEFRQAFRKRFAGS